MTKRLLVLEDGTVFEGKAFGADIDVTGEIVFNTGMTGYQESITDQSYNGQILTFTYPLVAPVTSSTCFFENQRLPYKLE